jgi:hypothetical protein
MYFQFYYQSILAFAARLVTREIRFLREYGFCYSKG